MFIPMKCNQMRWEKRIIIKKETRTRYFPTRVYRKIKFLMLNYVYIDGIFVIILESLCLMLKF